MTNDRSLTHDSVPSTAAANALITPKQTSDLKDISQACAQSRKALFESGALDANGSPLRLFSISEITKHLIPVTPAHLRRVLQQVPELPQGQSTTDGGAKWFTLDDVFQLRAYFASEGSKAKDYLPYRPDRLSAKVTAVANIMRDVGKTTVTAHLAMGAALDGYRVLVIDLDCQGAMTSLFGAIIDSEWDTIFPLVARHHAEHLRQTNQERVDRGESPLPLDDTLTRALDIKAQDIIRKTPWPVIDLIGAQVDLCSCDLQIPAWRLQSRSWKPWNAFRDILEADGILSNYDMVFIDTPPSLDHLTISGLTTADILLIPTGATAREVDGLARYLNALHRAFASIENAENIAARALGGDELAFEWEAVQAIVTRYDPNQHAGTASLLQASLGGALSPYRQDMTSIIGPTEMQTRTIYEGNHRNFDRNAFAQARASFDQSYASFKSLVTELWRDQVAKTS